MVGFDDIGYDIALTATEPISFTTEQNLPLPRLYHACAEESERHVPWIPTESCTLFLQLAP
jgi:hypothetical protein